MTGIKFFLRREFFIIAVMIGSLLAIGPGCSSAGESRSLNPSHRDAIIKVSETIKVDRGEIFDGGGALYDWVGAGDCSQTEGMAPMFKLSENSTLKNLRMRNAPDGIHIKGSNVTIDNIVNVDVCEDAISIKLDRNKKIPTNIRIYNSKFFDCEDKAIQITRGNGLLIKNNEFRRCAKPVRVKELAKEIRFEDNKIYSAKVAIKVTGGEIWAARNTIDGAKIGFWAEQGGIITNGGGNNLSDVIHPTKETEGGQIIVGKN